MQLAPYILLSSHIIIIHSAPSDQRTAAIQAVPPGVSLAPLIDNNTNTGNISPFLTNTLLQAIAEESELKKRVQRYRDTEK